MQRTDEKVYLMKMVLPSAAASMFILMLSSTANAQITVNVNGSCVDDPPLNDGYGWNGSGECRVSNANRTGTRVIAASGSCIDTVPLNDGYGWNGRASCPLAPLSTSNTTSNVVSVSASPTTSSSSNSNSNSSDASITVNVNGSCVDDPPLNDGYGWNGAASCRVSNSNRTGTMEIAAIGNCIDTVPLNDGYGWNGSASCELPPLNNSVVSSNPNVPQTPSPATPVSNTPSGGGWWQPTASENLSWQLQLQGNIVIKPGVDVYAVDSSASQASINAAKATGAKIMCYISAGSAENWRSDFNDFPSAVVGNAYSGWPGEWWLDVRNISALAPIMRARMDVCASKGFDVVDPDNINSWVNETGFPISRQDSIDYIRWLASEAHARGMAFSLKNSESIVGDLIDDIDMMQSESCFRYGNCANASRLTAANKPVFAVEYQEVIGSNTFRNQACATAQQYNFSMIYRDILLTPGGRYESCN